MNIDLKEEARRIQTGGVNVLPASAKEKYTTVGSWKRYQSQFFNEWSLFDRSNAICVITGCVSGNLEVIDFDYEAVQFDDFCEICVRKGLFPTLSKCLVERSQSGGKHLAYKVDEPIGKSQKLSEKKFDGDVLKEKESNREYIVVCNKKIYRDKDGNFYGGAIETKANGGLLLCAPSPGYEIIRGDWGALPVVSKKERDLMIKIALSLTERKKETTKKERVEQVKKLYGGETESVADYLRKNGIARKKLEQYGWKKQGNVGVKEFWTRPGKKNGVSATFDSETEMLYPFSSNCFPLEANKTYTPLQLIATMEFNGDESAASKEWAKQAAIEKIPSADEIMKVSFELGGKKKVAKKLNDVVAKRPTLPDSIFHCGGFLESVQQFTNENSKRLQPELSFAGALALTSFLVSRKITSDKGSTTPNLYLIGLGGASSGKNAARETNQRLLQDSNCLVVDKFESVQSLQNAICAKSKILLQQDEFGAELKTTTIMAGVNRYGIVTEMLKLFTNAGNVKYFPRVIAGNFRSTQSTELNYVIYPSLTVYGTTNYVDFSESATTNLLRNGFIARTTLVAGRDYSEKKLKTYEEYLNETTVETPKELKEFVDEWLEYRKCKDFEVPDIFDVPIECDAFEAMKSYEKEEIEPKHKEASNNQGDGLVEFLGRAAEKMRKYALLFAASKFGTDETKLVIDLNCAMLAIEFSRYEVKLFFYLLGTELIDTQEQKNVVDVKKWIYSLTEPSFSKRDFSKRFWRMSRREREETLSTLIDLDEIELLRVTNEETKRSTLKYFIKTGDEEC